MALIDFILNLAGLILWWSWRSAPFDPTGQNFRRIIGRHLASGGPAPFAALAFFGRLAALLFFRALLYWQIGPAVNWTPNLRLGAIALSFRSDFFARCWCFSVQLRGDASVFYLWLLLLSIVNGAGRNWIRCKNSAAHILAAWIIAFDGEISPCLLVVASCCWQ